MKKIVISGSMKFINEMNQLIKPIEELGYKAVVPEDDNWDSIPKNKINEYKKMVSKKHLSEIASDDTIGILVVNNSKHGTENYIGANTFAEIAIAFYFNKKIYLLNDIYEPYEDELTGWEVIPLNKNISKIEKNR